MFPIRCSEILPLIGFKARWTIVGATRKVARSSITRYKECNFEEDSIDLGTSVLATPAWVKPVEINVLDADTSPEVMAGVVLTLATAIVHYWTAFGAFESAYELVKVKGIGVEWVEKNRDSITDYTGFDSDC